MRRPSGGPGSNQYQTKPGGALPAAADRTALAAAVSDPDADEVAWVFHPDHAAWTKVGFGREDTESWLAAGGTLDDAVGYHRWLVRPSPSDACQAFVLYLSSERFTTVAVARDHHSAMNALTAYAAEGWETDVDAEPGSQPSDDRLMVWRYINHVDGLIYIEAVKTTQAALESDEPTVLAIDSEHGTTFFIGDEADAQQYLADYVDEWWVEELSDQPQPEDSAQAVAEYFDNVALEDYTITTSAWTS